MSARLVLSLSTAILLAGCRGGGPDVQAPQPSVDGPRVTFPPQSPQLGALRVAAPREAQAPRLLLNGRLAWDETSTVRVYSPFSGRVTQVSVEPGEHVERGAVLARIASAEFGEAEADARKTATELRLAERTLARVRDLYEHGAAARKDLEAAEADQARARAETERASARLAAYGETSRTVDGSFALRAPIAGVVVERNLSPGQEVRADQILAGSPQLAAPLFTLTDPTRLWVLLDVSEHDASRLHPGDPFDVRLHLDPSRAVTGRIEMVSEFLDPITRTVKVRGSLPNAERTLRAEMLVNVDVAAAQDVAVMQVPSGAVLLQGEKHFVFQVESPGTFERREVELGPERDGWLAIRSGLDTPREVVTQGAVLLEKIYQDNAGT